MLENQKHGSKHNPMNVPRFPLGSDKWSWAEPATHEQCRYLIKLLNDKEVLPSTLFGEGFTSIYDLSKFAASWGISTLVTVGENIERLTNARSDEEVAEIKTEMYMDRFISRWYHSDTNS